MKSEKDSIPEITIKAVLLGIVLSMILAAANAYLGLFAGMTVSASIPAAVVSMGVLRLFRKSNILENNIVQTAASAGESLAAGVIFTIPALVIMGFWKDFSYFWTTVIAAFGGLLGVLFTIPLRRSLIVEEKLQFPEGIATAEVLETGQKGGKGIWHIAKAAIIGGLFKIGAGLFGFWPGAVEGAKRIGGSIAYFGTDLSPALLSVGYIVGLNIAVLIFVGGALNWFIAIPICAALSNGTQDASAVDQAYTIWKEQTRYIGVGAMLVGGLWTIFQMRKSLLSGITSGLAAYKKSAGDKAAIERTEKDMPMKWIIILIIASAVPLYLVYQHFVRDVSVSLPMAVLMLAAGFIFSAVAGYMAGIVGSSNNPISGVTIATVTVSSLLLLVLMGKSAENGPSAAIIIGSVVCCAAAIAGDNMQDLKTGYIVGATPWKQQVMQIAGTLAGALVIAPVLMLLFKAYGFAGHSDNPDALAAPQANLMASVAQGVFQGNIPWVFVFIGMAVAIVLITCDVFLEARKSSFRTPVLAVAIGIYLPFELAVPIFVGGIIHQLVRKRDKLTDGIVEEVESPAKNGLLFASGLITGEALMGILLAIPIVILKQYEIDLPLMKHYGKTVPYSGWIGVILLIGVAYWLYRTALDRNK
ncbi:MAG: oligopeptide transporter, OPT family [Sedimentisphaerales bacterium]|nr:oligopeptide transporter, OPT family [Sedimentisphaerales bacterium]